MTICGVSITTLFATSPTFIELVQRIYTEQYTGPYTVHTLHGNPQMVEFPREGARILLDTARKRA